MTLEKLNELTAGILLFQNPSETIWLCNILEHFELRNVLEVGVAYGASMKIWEYFLEPGGILVGVDCDGMVTASKYIEPLIEASPKNINFVLGDSRDASTLEKVKNYFQEEIVDFLFIDSNHEYETTKQEYSMYGALVRPGGIIALHDVYQRNNEGEIQLGCGTFWQELKQDSSLLIEEYTAGNGMGVVYKSKIE